MSDLRPFRFGVLAGGLPPGQDWAAMARAVQERGYSTLVMPDHLDGQVSPLPALAAAAAVTSTLRVGTMVLCNDMRHPLLVARDAATIDLISGGRFELGLGAGWDRTDYARIDLAFEPAGTRIARLAEALAIVRGCLDEREFSFHGKHYAVAADPDRPMPAQARLPVFVGGGGARVLSLAARVADIVGVNPDLRDGTIPDLTDEAAGAVTDRQVDHVRAAAGSRLADLELSALVLTVHIGADAPAGATPHVLAGSVDRVVDLLVERRERWGISYLVVPGSAIVDFAPVVERLAGR